MKITRIDNGDGAEVEVTLVRAKDKIEGMGHFKAGTIDDWIKITKEGGVFTLRTPWALWKFEL